MFNIHVLSDATSIFYTYPEFVAKKGADEVASMLWDFIFNHLEPHVKELTIFFDSFAGQNKNYTLFILIHFIVHSTRRLQTVKMVFPIRDHSYLECDKNMGLINQRTNLELPEDWNSVLRDARVKPAPFVVIECDNQTSLFKQWTQFFSTVYTQKCPFPSRPVRELIITENHPRMKIHRPTYSGPEFQSIVIPPKRKRLTLPAGQFRLPEMKYSNKLPIPKKKYDDLQHLKQFCSQRAQNYYTALRQQ